MTAENDDISRHVSAGTLYLVATPIGNLDDITRRAVSVLQAVDIIAAEDTRHSQRLLSALSVSTRLVSYHEHNEDAMSETIIQYLRDGKSVALISDAGTPLVSDPGYRLVSRVHDEGLALVPVPGPCAAIAALSVSGLPTDRFSFEGFPPSKTAARLRYLEQRASYSQTMVFYESCHCIEGMLDDMRQVFGGERRVCYCRELSKTFETVRRAPLADIAAWVHADEDQRKGEIVLVVEGDTRTRGDDERVDEYLAVMMKSLPVKQAVALVAELTGGHRNHIYKRALELRDQGSTDPESNGRGRQDAE